MGDNILAFLVEARKAKGWSLTEAAKRAGIAKSALWELEKGKGNPRITTLVKIAHSYDVGLTVRFVEGPPPQRKDLCPLFRFECIRFQCAWWGKCPRPADKPIPSSEEEDAQKQEVRPA